jgi:muramoyltetrapeptide carboxypeptidase LdcA involved in peptidoglycan recycling
MLRHGIKLPSISDFENTLLVLETSEELPDAGYVMRVLRALGERGILAAVKGLLVGRPQAWNFDKPLTIAEKQAFKAAQRETILKEFRKYNRQVPVVQNLDIGHCNPQICLPMGRQISIDSEAKTISAEF